MATMTDGSAERRIEALIERGEEQGCVNLSELAELVAGAGAPDDELQTLHERLEARGIEVSDDCGHERRSPARTTTTTSWSP